MKNKNVRDKFFTRTYRFWFMVHKFYLPQRKRPFVWPVKWCICQTVYNRVSFYCTLMVPDTTSRMENRRVNIIGIFFFHFNNSQSIGGHGLTRITWSYMRHVSTKRFSIYSSSWQTVLLKLHTKFNRSYAACMYITEQYSVLLYYNTCNILHTCSPPESIQQRFVEIKIV